MISTEESRKFGSSESAFDPPLKYKSETGSVLSVATLDFPNSSLNRHKSILYSLCLNIGDTFQRCNPEFRVVEKLPQRILTHPSEPSAENPDDNIESNLICRVHDRLEYGSNSYTILDLLGTGTFGQVFRCEKDGSKEEVAIKIIKNKPAYHNQGQLEIKILDVLNKKFDPNDDHHIVRLLETFEYKNHICQVFEILGMSLLDILTQNQFRGLPLSIVQRFAKQILTAMVVLQEANIIHCDLKPENILLCPPNEKKLKSSTKEPKSHNQVGALSDGEKKASKITEESSKGSLATPANTEGESTNDIQKLSVSADNALPSDLLSAMSSATIDSISTPSAAAASISSTSASMKPSNQEIGQSTSAGNQKQGLRAVKIIDFGSACFEGKTMYSYIQSRFYRAPEVLIGVPYNGAIDMWSLGCVCAEMYLGLPLFPGVSQFNQLCRIVEMLGPPPDFLVERGSNGKKYFKLAPPSRSTSTATATSSTIKSSENQKAFALSSNSNNNNNNLKAPTDNVISNSRKYCLKTVEEYALETKTDVPVLKKYLKYDKIEDVIMKCPLANRNLLTIEQKNEEIIRRRMFLDFLLGLLQSDPWERWTAVQAIQHPFVTNETMSTPYIPVPDPKLKDRKAAFLHQLHAIQQTKAQDVSQTPAPVAAVQTGVATGSSSSLTQSQTQHYSSPQHPRLHNSHSAKLNRTAPVLGGQPLDHTMKRMSANMTQSQHQLQGSYSTSDTMIGSSGQYTTQQRPHLSQQSQSLSHSYSAASNPLSGSYGAAVSGFSVGNVNLNNAPSYPNVNVASSAGTGVGGSWVQHSQISRQREAMHSHAVASSYTGLGVLPASMVSPSSSSTQANSLQRHASVYGYMMSPGGHNPPNISSSLTSSMIGAFPSGPVVITDFAQALFRPDLDEMRHFQSQQQQQQQQQFIQQSSGAALSWTSTGAASSPSWTQPVLLARAPPSFDGRSHEGSLHRGNDMMYATGWPGQSPQQTASLATSLGGYPIDYQNRQQQQQQQQSHSQHRLSESYTMARSDPHSAVMYNTMPEQIAYTVGAYPYGIVTSAPVFQVPMGTVGYLTSTSLGNAPVNVPLTYDTQAGNVQYYAMQNATVPTDNPDLQANVVPMADADPFFAADDIDTEEWMTVDSGSREGRGVVASGGSGKPGDSSLGRSYSSGSSASSGGNRGRGNIDQNSGKYHNSNNIR